MARSLFDRYAKQGNDLVHVPGLEVPGYVAPQFEPIIDPVSPLDLPNQGPAGVFGTFNGNFAGHGIIPGADITALFFLANPTAISHFKARTNGESVQAGYCYGQGYIIYSTIPIDFYILGTPNHQTRRAYTNSLALALRIQAGTCQVREDPHVVTFGQQHYAYSGIGEHILTQWGQSNKITSCLFNTPNHGHSFQSSTSFKCGATTFVAQASSTNHSYPAPIRMHVVNHESGSLLSYGELGDFSFIKRMAPNVALVVCKTGSRTVQLTVTGRRYHGQHYINTKIDTHYEHPKTNDAALIEEGASLAMRGGFCQKQQQAQHVFLAGAAGTNDCHESPVSFPGTASHGHHLHDAFFDTKCGPASWKLEKGPINVLAATLPAVVDMC